MPTLCNCSRGSPFFPRSLLGGQSGGTKPGSAKAALCLPATVAECQRAAHVVGTWGFWSRRESRKSLCEVRFAQVNRERAYARCDSRKLIPEEKFEAVTAREQEGAATILFSRTPARLPKHVEPICGIPRSHAAVAVDHYPVAAIGEAQGAAAHFAG